MNVRLLEPAAARDVQLVDHLTSLINDAYAAAERGLWVESATRTTRSEVARLIGAREIAVATRDGDVVGSIRIHDVADDTSEFGVLVAAPDHRSTGVGRSLVGLAERRTRERGRGTMQLELLLPRAWRHPNKEFLEAWYRRIGYRRVRTNRVDDAYPQLAPLLATPCDLAIFQKPLA